MSEHGVALDEPIEANDMPCHRRERERLDERRRSFEAIAHVHGASSIYERHSGGRPCRRDHREALTGSSPVAPANSLGSSVVMTDKTCLCADCIARRPKAIGNHVYANPRKQRSHVMDQTEDRKRIARRLVENDPTLLTLEKLDTLTENMEIEYDHLEYDRYLDRLDDLSKLGDDWIAMMDD